MLFQQRLVRMAGILAAPDLNDAPGPAAAFSD